MLSVEGIYYLKNESIHGGGTKYNIVLDVDSISEEDMPIRRSDELILSQIHLIYNIPHGELAPYFQVTNITTIYPQEQIDSIMNFVQDSGFSKNFKQGLKLAYSPDFEDSGNRLGVALEILVTNILSLEKIPYKPKATLGTLLKILRGNVEIFSEDYQKFRTANESRIKSSHYKGDKFTKHDATNLADTIIYISETYFS